MMNILLVEDSRSFAQGMELLLRQHSEVAEVFYTAGFEESLEILGHEKIHVAILDLNFETKRYDGFVIAKKIRQQYPAVKIIILSQHTRKHYYNRLFNEGLADAYLDKQLGIEETFAALDAVRNGEQYIDRNITEMLEIETWMHVSKREREVIEVLSQGLTQKEAADQLFIAPKTIEVHIRNLFERFSVKNTTELVVKYLKYKNANREDVENSTPPFKR